MIPFAPAVERKTITRLADIPESHRELIDGPYIAVLSTVMPDGQPQTTPVWCSRRDGFILINVMKGFRKEKNMRLNPRVSLLVYDPQDPIRNLEIRGRVVEMSEQGAREHDDELAQLYLGTRAAHFFGDAVPAELESSYTPVLVKIAPSRIRIEGRQG
jgi:PPOX class probable F420-dependent enzyme